MDYERIDPDKMRKIIKSHEYRYKLAGNYTEDGDVVLDAACGTGYGKKFLKGEYHGVDKELGQDLVTWKPDFEYDVFVGLETIEHLEDYTNYVDIAKKAKKFIIISTPIVWRDNPHHLHFLPREKILDLFGEPHYEEIQDDLYGIYVFWGKGE